MSLGSIEYLVEGGAAAIAFVQAASLAYRQCRKDLKGPVDNRERVALIANTVFGVAQALDIGFGGASPIFLVSKTAKIVSTLTLKSAAISADIIRVYVNSNTSCKKVVMVAFSGAIVIVTEVLENVSSVPTNLANGLMWGD